MKPTTPLLTPDTAPLKPTTPLRPKTAPKTPISHPQRRWRFQSHTGTSEQRRQRFHTTGPPGRQGLTAAPAGNDDTTASQISHAIRLEEVSTISENVAIPTFLIHDSKESRGTCMRNWGSSAMMWILINTTHPTGAEGAGGPVGTAAVPVGDGAWPGNKPTRRSARQHTRPHWCGGRRRTGGHGCGVRGRRRGMAEHTRTTSAAGVEGAGGTGGHGRASRRGAERSEVA